MKKEILLFIFCILIINLVFAIEEFPPYKKGDSITLSFPCNLKVNQSQCPGSTECSITLKYPNSTYYINNGLMTRNGSMINYVMSNTDTVGLYQGTVNCTDGLLSGAGNFLVRINNSGNDDKPYGLAILMIIIPFLVGVGFLVWALNIDYASKFTMGESGDYVIELNYAGYLKLLLFFLSYMSIWIMTFFIWQASENYMIFGTYTDYIHSIWTWMTILIFPIFIVASILGMIKHVTDSGLLKLAKRGLKPR